jgi:hypothetical protein
MKWCLVRYIPEDRTPQYGQEFSVLAALSTGSLSSLKKQEVSGKSAEET